MTEDERLLATISIMAAVIVSRYSSTGGPVDRACAHEAKHAVGRARAIYNEAIDQLWPGEKKLKESKAPTGGESTPPFKGPRVGAGWSDENLAEDSGYHK
jgi:hypothetical protein